MSEATRRLYFGVGAVVLFGGLALAGGYFWAGLDNADRIAGFVNGVSSIGWARNGEAPAESAFRAEVEALAASHDVEIESMTISRSESTGLDATGRLANERLAPVGAVSMRLLVYEVAAQVVARWWIFRDRRTITARRSYRREVSLRPRTPAGVLRAPIDTARPMPPREAEQDRRGL